MPGPGAPRPQSPQGPTPGYGGYGAPQGPGGPQSPGGPGYGGPQGPGQPQWQGGQAPPEMPTDRGLVLRAVFHGLAALIIILGVSLPLDNGTFWTDAWTWAGLTTLAAIAQAAVLLPGLDRKLAWQVSAGAAATLVLTWTLVFLPMIGGDRGFMVTVGTALAVAAIWLHPARKEFT